jgi:hypothetical protein
VIAVRFLLGVATVVAVARWPTASFLTFWVLVVWLVPGALRDRGELVRLRASEADLADKLTGVAEWARLANERADQIVDLQSAVDQSTKRIRSLERELKRERAKVGKEPRPGYPLFRRVGLDPHCPKCVAEAVRREYRRKLHPDPKPEGVKREAERRFKEAEEVFAAIWERRGF